MCVGVPPTCSIFWMTAGFLRKPSTAWFSACTISGGVPVRVNTPNHVCGVNSGTPASAVVGIVGWSLTRLAEVTASARNWPERIYDVTEVRSEKYRPVSCRTNDMAAAGPPL
ncbi:Uncharacterised protein [Bordetella pertussis]|nr:Uncharacterised protein [Bordetella pertussis]